MVERTADGRIHTTQWEDVQYKHGNKVGKYRTHELELLAQRVSDANPNVGLRSYDPTEERIKDKANRAGYDIDPSQQPDTVEELLAVRRQQQGDDDDGGGGGRRHHDSDNDNGDGNGNDDDDDDDDLAALRRRRLAQMRSQAGAAAAQKHVNGTVRHIAGSDYVKEITEASRQSTTTSSSSAGSTNSAGPSTVASASPAVNRGDVSDEDDDDDENDRVIVRRNKQPAAASATASAAGINSGNGGCWVIGIMIKLGHEDCDALLSVARQVALRNRTVKFVSLIAREAVPNFPDAHLPCVLLYYNGSLIRQTTGLEEWCEGGGSSSSSSSSSSSGVERKKAVSKAALSVTSFERALQRNGVINREEYQEDDDEDGEGGDARVRDRVDLRNGDYLRKR